MNSAAVLVDFTGSSKSNSRTIDTSKFLTVTNADPRYLNVKEDSMEGTLNMQNNKNN